MSEDTQDRIHPATPARQQSARQDGEFAKSQQVSAAIQIIGGLVVAVFLLEPLVSWLATFSTDIWSQPWTSLNLRQGGNVADEVVNQLQQTIFSFLIAILPMGILLVGIGVLSHWCQTGPILLPGKPNPDISRLNPRQWFEQMFSVSGWTQPFIGLPKVMLALSVMVFAAWKQHERFFELGILPPDQIVRSLFYLIVAVSGQVAVTLFVASLLDYWLKHLAYQNRIKMSDQQLREEARMQNGTAKTWRQHSR